MYHDVTISINAPKKPINGISIEAPKNINATAINTINQSINDAEVVAGHTSTDGIQYCRFCI